MSQKQSSPTKTDSSVELTVKTLIFSLIINQIYSTPSQNSLLILSRYLVFS